MPNELHKLVEKLTKGIDEEKFHIALVAALETMNFLEGEEKAKFEDLDRYFNHDTWFEDFEVPRDFPYDAYTANKVARYMAATHLSELPNSVVVDQDARRYIDIVSIEDNDTVVLTRVISKIGNEDEIPDDPMADSTPFILACQNYIDRVFGDEKVHWRGDTMSVLICGVREAKVRRSMGIAEHE